LCYGINEKVRPAKAVTIGLSDETVMLVMLPAIGLKIPEVMLAIGL